MELGKPNPTHNHAEAMTALWKFARRFLLPVTICIAQTLVIGCADSRQDHRDIAGSEDCPDASAMGIDWPAKIGIGAWEQGPPGWSANRIGALGLAWYYTWKLRPLTSDGDNAQSEFVPMVWDAAQLRDNPKALTDVSASEATVLLGFNEPDRADQADMTVQDAAAHWPQLVATGKRLGSPAPHQRGAVGPGGWLPQFMDTVSASGLRVDFIAVHYYATSHDVAPFRRYLERVHRAYDKPVWVTEWALVDADTWEDGRARYSPDDTACFFRAGAAMLDNLDFVERHAWFAAFDSDGRWHLNTHAIAVDGSLTPVGRAIVDATGAGPD